MELENSVFSSEPYEQSRSWILQCSQGLHRSHLPVLSAQVEIENEWRTYFIFFRRHCSQDKASLFLFRTAAIASAIQTYNSRLCWLLTYSADRLVVGHSDGYGLTGTIGRPCSAAFLIFQDKFVHNAKRCILLKHSLSSRTSNDIWSEADKR